MAEDRTVILTVKQINHLRKVVMSAPLGTLDVQEWENLLYRLRYVNKRREQ